MSRSRVLTIFGLLLFCMVVAVPPLIYGYIYPNGSDDTAALYLPMIDSIKAGHLISYPFAVSYIIVGYPIAWLSNVAGWSVDILFLWCAYAALALTGIVIYFVMSRLVNRKAGWMALALTIFCSQGLLFQFHWGQTFNFINVGIILPLLLYFVVRYLTQGRIYQLALVLCFSGLFGSFHMSGVYLPAAAGFLVAAYLVYCLARRKHVEARPILLGIGIVLLSAVAFWKSGLSMVQAIPKVAVENAGSGLGIPIGLYLMNFVSPTVMMMLVFLAVYYKEALRSMTMEAKMLSVILAGVAVVLAVPAFSGFSLDSFRQGLDLATVMALLVSIPVSLFAWIGKRNRVALVLLLAVGFGLFRSLPIWFDNNNAIRQADKDAIAYVNMLDYGTYNCSPEIAPWIYDRFTEAKYSKNVSDLLIVRDVPMTPKSDIRNKWYSGHGVYPDDDYVLEKAFNDGKVEVEIYLARLDEKVERRNK